MKRFLLILFVQIIASAPSALSQVSQTNDSSLRRVEDQLAEVRRDQLNYRLEKDLLKEAYSSNLQIINGVLVFFLGVISLIGFFGPVMARWLNRDVHLRSKSTQPGIWSGFLLGFAFAFGWTPCIGPILATVLALAAASDTIARGVLLLAVYSAGLAIPFLLTALGIGQFMAFYKNFRKYLHAVELFSGALLLFVGGLVFVNKLTWLSAKLSFLNRFSL